MITDELLDHLGDYFVKMFIRERYGITFQNFLDWMDTNTKPSGRLMEFISTSCINNVRKGSLTP